MHGHVNHSRIILILVANPLAGASLAVTGGERTMSVGHGSRGRKFGMQI